MSDDLDAIRQRRMAELQGQQGGEASKQAEQQARQHEMKNNMLSAILDQPARARLNTIAQVKPDRAKQVEMILIQMMQRGQIMGRVGEDQLRKILEEVSKANETVTQVKFDRRRVNLSDDSDDE